MPEAHPNSQVFHKDTLSYEYSVDVKPLLDEAEIKTTECALRLLPEVVSATVQASAEVASPASLNELFSPG